MEVKGQVSPSELNTARSTDNKLRHWMDAMLYFLLVRGARAWFSVPGETGSR
jgi:hypothetical protein